MSQQHVKVQVVVYKYFNPQDLRFLTLLTKPERGAFWQNVTGSVEPGEYLLQAAHREVFEETTLQGQRVAQDLDYQFTYSTKRGPTKEYAFCIEAESADITIDPIEHTDFAWVSLEEALKRIRYESNKTALQKTFNSIS
jgi:8-oxo-dGTP pyrophosphatase MutT (NUDIX family)